MIAHNATGVSTAFARWLNRHADEALERVKEGVAHAFAENYLPVHSVHVEILKRIEEGVGDAFGFWLAHVRDVTTADRIEVAVKDAFGAFLAGDGGCDTHNAVVEVFDRWLTEHSAELIGAIADRAAGSPGPALAQPN